MASSDFNFEVEALQNKIYALAMRVIETRIYLFILGWQLNTVW